MKRAFIFFMVLLIVPLLAFNPAQPAGPDSPLEGVWELVSGEWEQDGATTVFPNPELDAKSVKCYTKGHFFVIGKWEEVYALSGTYVVKEDVYTETIEISAFGNTGTPIDIKFKVEGDKLILEADWFHEVWKRIE